MSVIQTVEMVEIRLMNKWVSPNGIHESAKSEERSSADQRESYRLCVYKDIDVLSYSGEHASRPSLLATVLMLMFHANDTDTRDPIDNRINLPMRAKSEKDGSGIPPAAQSAEKGKKDQEG